MNWLIILIYVFLSVGGQLLFKIGSQKDICFSMNQGIFKVSINWICIIGAICYIFSFLIYLYLISKYNLNLIIPVLIGMTYILTFLASFLVLHESVTIAHILGIVLIFVGVLLVVSKGKVL